MPAEKNLKKPVDKKTFYNRVGSGVQTSHRVPADMIKASGKFFFRGDTRPPEEIFAHGFSPREGTGIIYRTMDQDVRPESAVCITDSFDVASLFPIMASGISAADVKAGNHQPPAQTTVYMVRVKHIFCTMHVQQRFARYKVRDQGTPQKEQAEKNLFARECATEKIDASDVVAAVRVVRVWHGLTYLDGGYYAIVGCRLNEGRAEDLVEQGKKVDSYFRKESLERALGGTCHLAVAKERAAQGLPPNDGCALEKPLWEQVLTAENNEFVMPAWELALSGEL